MITPIHRIPQLDAQTSLVKQVEAELTHCTEWLLTDAIMDIFTPDDTERGANNSANDIVLDYAMQLRAEFGLPWAQSIRIATIFYFG